MQLARNLKAWSRDWVSLSRKSTPAHSAGQGSGVLQKSESPPPERVHSTAIFSPLPRGAFLHVWEGTQTGWRCQNEHLAACVAISLGGASVALRHHKGCFPEHRLSELDFSHFLWAHWQAKDTHFGQTSLVKPILHNTVTFVMHSQKRKKTKS